MPLYLTTRNHHFYFNRRVGSHHLRLSLHTKESSVAQIRASILFVYTAQLFRAGLSFIELRRMTRIRAAQLYEESLYEGTGLDVVPPYKESLCENTGVDSYLATPLAPTPSPIAYSDTTVSKRIKTTIIESNHITPPPSPSIPMHPMKLSGSICEALKDIDRVDSTTPENRRKYEEAWREVANLNPGIYFHDIRFADAKAHLTRLMRLPKRRTDKLLYKAMPIAEVVELDISPSELLSATTINERIKRIARLWQWAIEHDAYEGANPFASKSLRLPEQPRERGRYSSHDIRTLLASPLFADRDFQQSSGATKSWYWLILLGMLTGARIGELTQLATTDLITADGITCISINEDDDKSVKTAAGIRLVPVHPELVRLGFLEYVAHLRSKGVRHILPYPNSNASDASQRASKWFNGTYRPRHLPAEWTEQNKVFHSWRHTWCNRALRELHLPVHRVQAVIGHEPEGLGETSAYVKGSYKLADLMEVVDSFHFGDVDFTGLIDTWKDIPRD